MKEKRKNRLDKGKSSEFIGFNAFATTPTFGSLPTTSSAPSNSGSVSWSPIYTGSDSTIQTAFSWLTSKRDSVTHVKALQTLTDYIGQSGVDKKSQSLVVQHWIWLYHRKLYFDATPAVRAASLQLWLQIRQRLPKAWANLVQSDAAATASTNASVVLGMLYSALVDSATEVQQVALDERTQSVLFKELPLSASQANNEKDESSSGIDWPGGILAFVEYILSCGRHSVFYEKLLQGKKSTQTSSYSDLGEEQKDNVLETYTRVTGIALDTLVHYLRHNAAFQSASVDWNPDTTVWYKTLASPHAHLRRRTYSLVAAVAFYCPECRASLPNLSQSLSSEKEPANWPTLLETVLAVTQSSEEKTLVAAYVGPVIKAWKKALYGANMTVAGPMLLPLTALIPTPVDVWKLLHAAWEGRDLTLGGTDRWRKINAIAESLSFGLLRKQSDPGVMSQYNLEWPDLFGQLFLEALRTEPSGLTGTTMAAHGELLKSLGQLIPRMESALLRQNIYGGRATNALEFLSQQESVQAVVDRIFPLLDKGTTEVIALSSEALSNFVRNSLDLVSDDSSPLIPLLSKVFESLCPRKASGDVPTRNDYNALEAILDRVSCHRLFQMDGLFTTEKFVMNDLLRWSIIHTSNLAVGQPQNGSFVKSDFQLLYRCLDSLDSTEKKGKLWESFLREIVMAKCNLEWFTLALQTLRSSCTDDNVSWMKCRVLDDFIKEVSSKIDAGFDDNTSQSSGEESADEVISMNFLSLCFGISNGYKQCLVDPEVVKSLVREICEADLIYGSNPSPIERTLLRVVQCGRADLLEKAEENMLVLHAWSQKSHRLVDDMLACLKDRFDLIEQFITEASILLKDKLSSFVNSSTKEYRRQVDIWTAKAYDLVQVCRLTPEEESFAPSLSLIGLSDLTMWRTQSDLLFDLSMALFELFPQTLDRFQLLSECTGISTTDLLTSILLELSEASTNLAKAEVVRLREDRSARFLTMLGWSSLDHGFVELCLRDAIKRLDHLCKTKSFENYDILCCHVSVISQLAGGLFRRIDYGFYSALSAESIKEGDRLWYIPDSTKPHERIPAEIMKAHFDAEAGYYFSIKVKKGEDVQERQTVVSRLRKSSSDAKDANLVDLASIPDEEKAQRMAIRDLMCKILVGNFESLSWRSCIPELLNILVSQVGLGEERGIGSPHYALFQLLTNEISKLKEAMAENCIEAFGESAWKLSQACGYGVSVPSCSYVCSVFKIDSSSLLQTMCEDYSSFFTDQLVSTSSLSLISTLFYGLDKSGDGCLSQEVTSFVSKLLETEILVADTKGFTENILLGLRSLNELLGLCPDSDDSRHALTSSIAGLTNAFAISWEDSKAKVWTAHFEKTVELTNKKVKLLPALSAAAAATAEELSLCLFSKSKQHLAFCLLQSVAKREMPLRNEAGIVLAESTKNHTRKWTDGLTDEETDEMMQDIEVVSQWVPLNMMTEIEKWHEENFESVKDDESIGRFLVWLTVLQIIDTAAPLDFRNRPAFVSFLRLTESSGAILNRAILYDPYVNDPKGLKNLPPISPSLLVKKSSDVDVERLASLTIFRTAEVLPSLCRHWWEEECPKVYVNPMQTLVEKQIAPTILQRELKRVRQSTGSFGDMNVSGSVVTRQITATYVQDDFTLKVLIQLPSVFPLRSAEVDCSKTLGVPQARWKRWSLQITQMLNNQGGTLQDALLLWKDNVDKEFEGVEPCPVCYSVLHVKTHKLPTLECCTCHNRFHSDCLQQWFRSSGKSQCVLCQQDWRGTRVA